MFEGIYTVELAGFTTINNRCINIKYTHQHNGEWAIVAKVKLKEHRERLKLTHEELSAKSGVARSYIIELEEGKYQNPSVEVLCKLAKAMGVGLSDLVECE